MRRGFLLRRRFPKTWTHPNTAAVLDLRVHGFDSDSFALIAFLGTSHQAISRGAEESVELVARSSWMTHSLSLTVSWPP
jgi:hypothetical protein